MTIASPIKAYSRVIDYAGIRPSQATVHQDGAVGIIRYSAGVASDPSHPSYHLNVWKLCGLNEIHDAVAAGNDFIANSEWYADRVEEGASAGAADGAVDYKFWSARGLAKGSSIYCSWDVDDVTSKMDEVAAYLTAYNKALRGIYHVDLYGGDHALKYMLQRGIIRYGWRSMSDAWSDDGKFYQPGDKWLAVAKQVAAVSPAHIIQNGNYWFNKGADEDVIIRLPVGSHLEALEGTAPAPKPPAPKPAPDPYALGKRTLKLASPMMHGSDVKWVQNFIGSRRCGTADGYFGANTRDGVKWYQRMRGIGVDGIVGPQTWKNLLSH